MKALELSSDIGILNIFKNKSWIINFLVVPVVVTWIAP